MPNTDKNTPIPQCDKTAVSSSATIFEVELYRFINEHVKNGLSKTDLIHKMKYVLKSCEMSWGITANSFIEADKIIVKCQ